MANTLEEAARVDAVLFEGDDSGLRAVALRLAEWTGPILSLQATVPEALITADGYDLNGLLEECTISTNTAAAGGNATLMSIG